MPIPPRSIPTPAHNTRTRPGSSVPRKSLPSSQLHNLDWRSELALLGNLPRSAPSNPGIRVVEKAKALREKAEAEKDRGEAARREVGIEGMILEGKGRVKRATTATNLGFDFVTNPSVLALPDRPTSLLTATKAMKSGISPALSGTPATPALVPTHVTEEEDDGWEHVPSSPYLEAERRRDNGDMSEDEDVIVLGELELEVELEALDMKDVEKRQNPGATKGLSYAAALAARKV